MQCANLVLDVLLLLKQLCYCLAVTIIRQRRCVGEPGHRALSEAQRLARRGHGNVVAMWGHIQRQAQQIRAIRRRRDARVERVGLGSDGNDACGGRSAGHSGDRGGRGAGVRLALVVRTLAVADLPRAALNVSQRVEVAAPESSVEMAELPR